MDGGMEDTGTVEVSSDEAGHTVVRTVRKGSKTDQELTYVIHGNGTVDVYVTLNPHSGELLRAGVSCCLGRQYSHVKYHAFPFISISFLFFKFFHYTYDFSFKLTVFNSDSLFLPDSQKWYVRPYLLFLTNLLLYFLLYRSS